VEAYTGPVCDGALFVELRALAAVSAARQIAPPARAFEGPMRALLLSVLCSTAAFAAPDVSHAKVVVVRGSADHMEQVLQHAKVDFVAVSPADLPELALNAKQVLMVNCTGDMSPQARERVRRFVAAGGFLYTTDHAVHQLIEPIFPHTIAWTGQTTQEQVFPIKVRGTEADRGLLSSLGGNAKEHWQTAGGGYAVKVLDPKRVTVLMESDEVAKAFGSGVIAVRFPYEDGQVIHVTGHFYSQPGQQPAAVASAGRGFETFSSNVVQEKARDERRIDGLYSSALKRAVPMMAAPAAGAPAAPMMGPKAAEQGAVGTKVRVLETKSGYAKVRDEQGNDGWVPADAL